VLRVIEAELGERLAKFVTDAVKRGVELRREALRLRKEFTERRRDDLLNGIEQHAEGSPEARRASAELQYFLTSLQINSAERGARQLSIATWVLATATLGLCAATIVLVVVTATHGA
jgi:hypothetical protein